MLKTIVELNLDFNFDIKNNSRIRSRFYIENYF